MNRSSMILTLAAFAFAANAGASTGLDDPVAVNVDHLQPRVAAEVEKHAAAGYKSLARYMERTRAIHRLWFDDVTQPKSEAAPLDRKVASREFRKHAIEYR